MFVWFLSLGKIFISKWGKECRSFTFSSIPHMMPTLWLMLSFSLVCFMHLLYLRLYYSL